MRQLGELVLDSNGERQEREQEGEQEQGAGAGESYLSVII